jgi:hypothetical protein
MAQYLILFTKATEVKLLFLTSRIIWDNSQTPVTHAQCRICLEKDLAEITLNYFKTENEE